VNPLIELEQLVSLFPESEYSPLYHDARHVAREATPEPYHRLLVHEHHMTVTMESYHDCQVEVEVIESRYEDDLYCRKILLRNDVTQEVVQFGIVQFNFGFVTDSVRQEIESQQIPLGRVLIQHNVLRHIDLGAIIELTAGPGLAHYLEMNEGETTYGRMATIFCDGQPAVDLFEVSSPLS
jgi:chorismate-pyruvate lyase